MRILVAYASADGSTAEIAQHISAHLRDRGHDPLAVAANTVGGIQAFDAVILGSAVHARHWLDEAATFVNTHRNDLGDRPLWTFSVGMPDALPHFMRKLARAEESGIIAALEGIEPVGHRLFSGVVRPSQFPLVSRIFLRLAGGRYGDCRDWPAIDRWTDEICDYLQRTPPSATVRDRSPGPAVSGEAG